MTKPLKNEKMQDAYIEMRGLRVNNLKNIDVRIPSNKLVVVTGLSGSGKSSLVFDTLFAEGQRRYVESLSSYARQFLGRMPKPDLDFMDGVAPAIAIEQKTLNKNPRSTVGSITEINEYLKLLYARVGRIYSPISGKEVTRQEVQKVASLIVSEKEGSKVYIMCRIKVDEHLLSAIRIYIEKGFSRLFYAGKLLRMEDFDLDKLSSKKPSEELYLLVDRLMIRQEDETLFSRAFDSVKTAYGEGDGECYLRIEDTEGQQRTEFYSNRLEMDGMSFVKPSVNFFSYNNPYGACQNCGGIGNTQGIDENLVIPDKNLSVYDNAVACWRGEKMKEWKEAFVLASNKYAFPIHRAYSQLSEKEKDLLWNGQAKVKGIHAFFKWVEDHSYKIQYQVLRARYMGKPVCPQCKGSRLRPDASYVKVGGVSLPELWNLSVEKLREFTGNLEFGEEEAKIAKPLLIEIDTRLDFLIQTGLPYLSLNRSASTLSGGESQRIHLASALGSSLVGSMYILDEPSIGLHPRDTSLLIDAIKKLRDLGNSVIVVEHDAEMMKAADQIIDIGPYAGRQGGELVFQGSPDELCKIGKSLTADYMSGRKKVELPSTRRAWKDYIEISGAHCHNLKNIDVKFPLGIMMVVTGVSGSGKTSLVKNTLYPALKNKIEGISASGLTYTKLSGSLKNIERVELVTQDSIGKSSRSNPATYLKIFDPIRNLFAAQKLAIIRGYNPGYFSFNIEGGRCDACQGEGQISVQMQFMADISLPCEQCGGKRFKEEVLEILYQGKNVYDVLNMTVDEAYDFFKQDKQSGEIKSLLEKIKTLQDVGLGYLSLGQSSNSLSGGESQRIKLAFFLGKGNGDKKTFFIFDEPTTGLHIHDIAKLKIAFDALLENGHTVLVVEHHPEVVKLADWVIDLGPEGGEKGGDLIFEGRPEELVKRKNSFTGTALKEVLK